ncbi:MAG: cardiolipin synthase [Planctomycetes bacterium]|jgi:cardiolipin synthase|nr:cardiolipin synthase [Planctomycetota bacterium]
MSVDFLLSIWPWLLLLVLIALNLAVSARVILIKRDSHTAVNWLAIFWLAPFLGVALYWLLGINRIQRRARRLRRKFRRSRTPTGATAPLSDMASAILATGAEHLTPLAQLGETITGNPLCPGNSVAPLMNGDQAYPVMMQAIDEATQSVSLAMYIFENDQAGNLFVAALGRAVARGVEVRVLVDDIGAHFTWRSIVGPLRQANVPVACFLRTLIPRYFAYANLRSHRKILVVDGRLGFTGGMNIGDGNCLHLRPAHPIRDLMFRMEGLIVSQMQKVFVEDWSFTTGETLHGPRWFPTLVPHGPVLARGVSSGPDEDLEKLRFVLLGALNSAQQRVVIVTPYFLPDVGLISALNITALRGVQIDIVLPKFGDLRLVQWASTAQLWQVLEHGCRVWIDPDPFPHTKLMIVDGVWTLLGSGNWDARSLRLNFEFNIECYDRTLARELEAAVDATITRSERVTLTKLNQRPFPVKLRDGVARLFMPYL